MNDKRIIIAVGAGLAVLVAVVLALVFSGGKNAAPSAPAPEFGDLTVDPRVNLERALPAGGRLSGHFVQGHVDCTSEVLALEPVGQDWRFTVALPAAFRQLCLHRGSICVDGMSLTMAELTDESFTIWITPHTYAVTNLQTTRPGGRVNLEFDLLAKYIQRLTEVRG